MAVRIGSARCDENGKLTGGRAGDQNGREVSEQNFYVHSKGWYILRPKSPETALKIAERMRAACNNPNLGYDQNQRTGVIKNGIDSKIPTECDCSALVRACVKEATGKDPGNFTTANEKGMLMATGLFDSIVYKTGTKICTGDILVTKSRGHTVICTEGNKRTGSVSYFPKCSSKHSSLVDALKEIEADTSKEYREKIALKNGIMMYNGSATQNLKLLRLLKDGKLLKP